MYRKWYRGLIRTSNSAKGYTYLSDVTKNLASVLVIAKFVQTNREKPYMLYSAFNNYVDLHEFIKATPPNERVFHEVALSSSNQKPRFDIDISLEDYIEFFGTSDSGDEFVCFGEWMKDVVIETAIAVLNMYGITLDVSRDFAVFTSHNDVKRSYHIVLCRLFHYGCEQAKEFYSMCMNSLANDVMREIYYEFVDPAAYNKNKSLRLLWSNKKTRVKAYEPTFMYHGAVYKQILTLYTEGMPISLYNKIVLAHSLITFTAECNRMPVFSNALTTTVRPDVELSDSVVSECIALIDKWNSKDIYERGEYDCGKIQMKRLIASYCIPCGKVHHTRPSFCHVVDDNLYHHCGKAKGYGTLISALTTVVSRLNHRLNVYRAKNGLDTSTYQHTIPNTVPQNEALLDDTSSTFTITYDADCIADTDLEFTYNDEVSQTVEYATLTADTQYVQRSVNIAPWKTRKCQIKDATMLVQHNNANAVISVPAEQLITICPTHVHQKVRIKPIRCATTNVKPIEVKYVATLSYVGSLRGKSVISSNAKVPSPQQSVSLLKRCKPI